MNEDEVFVSHSDFDISRFKLEQPKARTSKNNTKYHTMPIQYNYGTDDNPLYTDLYFQLPSCTLMGIKKYNTDIANHKFITILSFDLSDETTKCIKKIDLIHKTCCDFLHKNKTSVGFFDFDNERPGLQFGKPVCFVRDKLTGDIIKDKKPWMIVNVIRSEQEYEKSEFLYQDMDDIDPISGYPNLKSINLLYLMESIMKVIPLIKFESINVQNNRAVIRCVLVSAIVLDYKDKNIKKYRQISTSNKIYDSNPIIANKITALIPRIYKSYSDDISEYSNIDNYVGEAPIVSSTNCKNDKDKYSNLDYYLGKVPIISSTNCKNDKDRDPNLNDYLGKCKDNHKSSSMDDYLGKAPITSSTNCKNDKDKDSNLNDYLGKYKDSRKSSSMDDYLGKCRDNRKSSSMDDYLGKYKDNRKSSSMDDYLGKGPIV